MQLNSFVKATVSIIIMVVIVVTVAIPIIGGLDNASGDNSGETATYTIGGSHYVSYSTAGSSVDGDVIANPSSTTYLMIADTFNVSIGTTGTITVAYIDGTTYTSSTLQQGGQVSISNGVAKISTELSESAPTEVRYSKAFTYDTDGSWGSYSGTTIKGLESTTVTAWAASSTQMGMADIRGGELVSSTAYTISTSTATAQTITSVTSGYTEDEEDGTVSYTAPMTLTYSSGSISATTVLAPVHYGVENSEAINSMITLVPLLIVVGMIIAVISIFLTRKG